MIGFPWSWAHSIFFYTNLYIYRLSMRKYTYLYNNIRRTACLIKGFIVFCISNSIPIIYVDMSHFIFEQLPKGWRYICCVSFFFLPVYAWRTFMVFKCFFLTLSIASIPCLGFNSMKITKLLRICEITCSHCYVHQYRSSFFVTRHANIWKTDKHFLNDESLCQPINIT